MSTLMPSTKLTFDGTIWNMLAHPDHPVVFTEIRDEGSKKVSFSAVDLSARQLLFDKLTFDEPWWMNLSQVAKTVMLLTVYMDSNNPDKKSVIAYDYQQKKIIWWKNNFSVSEIKGDCVVGSEPGAGIKILTISLTDGQPCPDQSILPDVQNFSVRRPLQYYQDSTHFSTVKSFLSLKFEITALHLIEYLEFEGFVIISCYSKEKDLANYLFVLNSNGEIMAREKLGDDLKGVGLDTFFVFAGFLVFVKNKRELVSYKLV